MKPSTCLSVTATLLALASSLMVACSSSNNNVGPTVFDSGSDGSTPKPDSNTAVDSGTDTSTPPSDSATGSDGGTPDTGIHIDANLPDVGACVSDAATCNSCYTPAQNPLNGCSAAAVNCIPFDNTRIPAGAP